MGSAAWKIAARDQWIGWSAALRESQISKVLNNARFLILPWVRSRNLASKVLALSEPQVAIDYEQRYGIKPVLLETFVEQSRFRGTCYRAANWSDIRSRKKCDPHHRTQLPIKDLYVRPLIRRFRSQLGVIA